MPELALALSGNSSKFEVAARRALLKVVLDFGRAREEGAVAVLVFVLVVPTPAPAVAGKKATRRSEQT